MAEQVAPGTRAGLAFLIATSLTAVVTLSVATSGNAQPAPAPAVPAQTVPAQTVPIPKPAPKARYRFQLTSSDPQRHPITTSSTPAPPPPNPLIPYPRRNLPLNMFATFDASQKAQVRKPS